MKRGKKGSGMYVFSKKCFEKKKEEGEGEYGFVRSRFGRWSFAGGPR